MSKFKVGDKVLVLANTYYLDKRGSECVGKVCEIKTYSGGDEVSIYTPDKSDWWIFNVSDLSALPDTPKEITLNGATYVLKEEPKPEHEWKFGDIAVHDDYGVGMVFSEHDVYNYVRFAHTDDWDWADIKDLTFLRRADLSV